MSSRRPACGWRAHPLGLPWERLDSPAVVDVVDGPPEGKAATPTARRSSYPRPLLLSTDQRGRPESHQSRARRRRACRRRRLSVNIRPAAVRAVMPATDVIVVGAHDPELPRRRQGAPVLTPRGRHPRGMWPRRYATTETNTWSGGAGPAPPRGVLEHAREALHERAEADAQRRDYSQRVPRRAAPRGRGTRRRRARRGRARCR